MTSIKKDNHKKILHAHIKKIGAGVVLALLLLGITGVWASGPYDATWGISVYDSDVYNMEDLTFVWDGETGNATNKEVTGCSEGNCLFDTSYNQTGMRTVNVFAKNIYGERVSNIATCSAEIQQECPCALGYVCVNNRCVYEMDATCAGYATPTATNPTLFFDPSTSVYWKPTVVGGTAPYRYSWTLHTESQTLSNTNQTAGPYFVQSTTTTGVYDYARNKNYQAELAVRDANNKLINVSCTIATKQCQYTLDCVALGFPSNYYCDQGTFTCVPPKPVFVKTLAVTQGVINKGQQCNLSWEVANATRCDVYRNDALYPFDGSTATTSFAVVPGTYYVKCTNAVDEIITAGPAQCIYNPEIRES